MLGHFAMVRPNWQKILETLYDNEIVVNVDASGGVMYELLEYLDNELTDLNQKQIQNGLETLNRLGMIDAWEAENKEGKAERWGGLTKKGFEVAHQRELETARNESNLVIAILTLILAISAAVQAYSAFLSHGPWPDWGLLIVIMTGFAVLGVYLIHRTFL